MSRIVKITRPLISFLFTTFVTLLLIGYAQLWIDLFRLEYWVLLPISIVIMYFMVLLFGVLNRY